MWNPAFGAPGPFLMPGHEHGHGMPGMPVPEPGIIPIPHGYMMPPHGVLPMAFNNNAVEEKRDLISLSVDSKMNLDLNLYNAIQNSTYFRQLCTDYPEFDQVLQALSEEVKHVEPLDPGKAKQPSVAFCCLAKFVLIKLDRRQLRLVLQHKKPLVRAVGILYLRIAANVKEIYEWLDPFLGDDTQFCPMVDSKRSISFGEFIMGCFADLKYFPNCVLRRIPQNLLNDMERKTVEREILRERAEVHRHLLQAGVQCQCKYVDGKAYPIVIDEALQNRNFLVTYSEYAEQAEVPITDLVFDPATLRGAKGSRDHDREEHRRDRDRRDRSRSPDRRDRSRSPDRRDRRSGRDRDDDRERRRRSRTPEKKDRSERPQLSLQEEITQRIARKRKTNMDKHVASDGNYAKLPTGYKKALGETVETVNRPRFEPRR